MVRFYRQFGVPFKLKRRIQIYNHVYLGTIFTLVGFLFVIFEGKSLPFFQNNASRWPYVLFAVDLGVTCLYMLIHPRSNPGKANWQLLPLVFSHTTTFFKSINAFQTYYRIHCTKLDNMPRKYNHRLPVNIKYLRQTDDK